MKKLLILIAVIVPILAVVRIGWKSTSPLCGEEVVSVEPSPDGRYVAVWMRRDCGATTAYADHINMRLANEKFEPSFLSGTIKQGEVFTLDTAYGRLIRLRWAGSRKLIVEYSSSADTLPRKNSWKDVSIEYPHRTSRN
jgi:hypothetical protein